jgi:asparagine synthase (glutamine-hydrolysing)
MASDLLAYLPGDLLVKMDITTMASSLEARAPLLDHQLVEYLCQLPRHYKVSPWNSKLILRSAMRGILPPELLRRGKMGFEAPVASWLRGPLRPMVEDLVLRSTSHVRSYLRGEIIDDVANDHLSGRHDRTRLLWCLLMLELWFEIVVRQTPAAREQVVQAH